VQERRTSQRPGAGPLWLTPLPRAGECMCCSPLEEPLAGSSDCPISSQLSVRSGLMEPSPAPASEWGDRIGFRPPSPAALLEREVEAESASVRPGPPEPSQSAVLQTVSQGSSDAADQQSSIDASGSLNLSEASQTVEYQSPGGQSSISDTATESIVCKWALFNDQVRSSSCCRRAAQGNFGSVQQCSHSFVGISFSKAQVESCAMLQSYLLECLSQARAALLKGLPGAPLDCFLERHERSIVLCFEVKGISLREYQERTQLGPEWV